MATTVAHRYLLHLDLSQTDVAALLVKARSALARRGDIEQSGRFSSEHFLLSLHDGEVLGDVLSSLATSGIRILGCREERSEIERAFLHLTREEGQ